MHLVEPRGIGDMHRPNLARHWVDPQPVFVRAKHIHFQNPLTKVTDAFYKLYVYEDSNVDTTQAKTHIIFTYIHISKFLYDIRFD